MSNKRIYLCLAHMSESGMEQKYIKEAFDTNWVVPLGPNVNAFEKDLEEFVNGLTENDESAERKGHTDNTDNTEISAKRVVALSSGTAAVHLALLACGVGPGDEVIVQSFTFCASANPIVYVGATPIFVDSEHETWNMDPALLEQTIQDRIAKTGRKPKAIITVYLYGMPAKIDEIMEIAKRYEIPVIEDAAEAFGSRYKGQMVGTFGDYGILSFNGNKMITTSGGGALICPNQEAKDKIMWLATQAREAYPYYQHEAIGYNYRMSNICAGIGRGQMTVAEQHIAHHRKVQRMYEELLKEVPGIKVHSQPTQSYNCHTDSTEITDKASGQQKLLYDSNYWLCTIVLDEKVRVKGEELAYAETVQGAVGGAAGVVHGGGRVHTDCEPNKNVEALRLALDKEGIESRPLWKPMHCQPVYRRTEIENGKWKIENLTGGAICQTSEMSVAYVNGVSESLFKRGLCLPSGPCITDADVARIVETIKKNIL